MTIKLYAKDANTFIGNMDDTISCIVTEERNGQFKADLQYPNGYPLSDQILEGNIIECNANDTLLNQKFRIYKITKTMGNKINIYTRHISFDLANDFIKSISIVNQPCNYALNEIFRNSNFSKNYQGFSDIVNAQNYNMEMANCLEAIVGKQGSIIDTYGTGAEILRDNTNFHVLNRRGRDNGVHISYAKNMTDITVDEDKTDLITRIFAFAKGKDSSNNEIIITAPGDYVDSPNIGLYEHPYIRSIDFSDKFGDNEQPTPDKIKAFAERYFRDNQCDIPKLTYKISFVPLSKTTEGGPNDNISLCDTVYVNDTRYNIQTQAKAIKTVFNVLKNRYDNIELGSPRDTLRNEIGDSGQVGPAGPPGPQGPPGADGDIGDFPDSLPIVPQLDINQLGMASIECNWTYENKVYYRYQLYASKIKDFNPTAFDLIFEGQASSFLFAAKPGETWYFRVRGANTHNRYTEFSSQATITLAKSEDMDNYFTTAAIGKAVVGSLTADYMTAGIIKGNWIDAKQLSVTDGNGKRTLDIDSFGNVSLMPRVLKILSSGGDEYEVATTAQLEQSADSIKLSVSNAASPNLLPNGRPVTDNKAGWGIEGNGIWFDGPYGQSTIGFGNLSTSPSYNYTDAIEVIPNTTYTVSAYVSAELNVTNCTVFAIGSDSPTGGAIQPIKIVSVNSGEEKKNSIIFLTQSNVRYIKFRVDHNGYNGDPSNSQYVVWMKEFMLLNGAIENPNYRGSSNEIKNNIVTVNTNGIEIKHGDGSKADFSNDSIDFFNQNGYNTLKIKDGGLNFHHPQLNEMVGFIKPSQVGSEKTNNGVTLANYALGDYVSIGYSESNDENYWNATSCIVTSNGIGWGRDKGTSIVNNPFYCQTESFFRHNMNLDYTFRMKSNDEIVPHNAFNTSDGKWGIFGNEGLKLGVRASFDNKYIIHIFEDSTSPSYGAIESYGNWDFKNYTMYNMRTTNSLQAQSAPMMLRSAFTSFMAMPSDSYDYVDGPMMDYTPPEKEINLIHSTMSYTEDEIRYTSRTNQIISNKTLIVELPQILSENMENDYHVNISKMSWGDYRIIEKNPYYFEIETNVDNFSFTYEIVGKLIERVNTDTSIASRYILQEGTPEAPEPEKFIQEIV